MDVLPLAGDWLTYPDAAIRLGKSEAAVRIQAKRERWQTRKNPNGRIEVCVPTLDDAIDGVSSALNDRSITVQQGSAADLFRQVGELSYQKGRLQEQLLQAKRDLAAADRQIRRLMRQIDEMGEPAPEA